MDRAAERSLALHRAVAERLRDHPELVERARTRVATWLTDGSVHRFYARAWDEVLAGPLPAIERALADPGEYMTALRQASPFAGALDARERWRILRELYQP